ncbi:MAG TPA: hypothetical protein VMS18_28545 [Candidatus Binatia bacterium]|nr:hypothetical protein [Candidatus Binatia bacterium]
MARKFLCARGGQPRAYDSEEKIRQEDQAEIAEEEIQSCLQEAKRSAQEGRYKVETESGQTRDPETGNAKAFRWNSICAGSASYAIPG